MSGSNLEDFVAGDRFESSETYEMTAERVSEYAAEYDPQPIHLDATAARNEMFGELIASGWHSLSVTMRLFVRSKPLGGRPLVGIGIDKLRFLAPVRIGDRLGVEWEVLGTRPSQSDASRGYLVLRIVTRNQDGLAVLTQDWTILVPRST